MAAGIGVRISEGSVVVATVMRVSYSYPFAIGGSRQA